MYVWRCGTGFTIKVLVVELIKYRKEEKKNDGVNPYCFPLPIAASLFTLCFLQSQKKPLTPSPSVDRPRPCPLLQLFLFAGYHLGRVRYQHMLPF